jgi:glycoprotein endo-alpha-1,2-mannosidase
MRLLLLALALAVPLPAASASAPSRAPVSIFYYPWYGTPARDGAYDHWQQQWHLPPADIASNFYPARGPYSSGNPTVVAGQMREIAAAGIAEVVSSWWGWGSLEDERLPLLIAEARKVGLSVAVQIEPFPDRSVETLAAAIPHLLSLGITRFYVYQPFADLGDADWARLNAGLTGVQLLAQTANAIEAAADGFQGIYTYDILTYGPSTLPVVCARARAVHILCAPSVGPGYDASRATGDPRIRSRRNGASYDSMWRAAIASHPDLVTITSYNEWHEGTQIEPARERSFWRGRVLSRSPVEHFTYQDYDGAFGLHGRAAGSAYLGRTAYWTRAFARSR